MPPQPPSPTLETAPLLPSSPSSPSEDAQSPTQTPIHHLIPATMLSFLTIGLFTSTLGPMLSPLSEHYSLTPLHVSFIFLVGPLGYILAAYSNSFTHAKFGQRGIAVLGPVFHGLGAGVIALHGGFWSVLVGYAGVAVGNGVLDGSWCAWAGGMGEGRANMVSGLLHGSFSVGAAAGPFLVGQVIFDGGADWWVWYYLLLIASVVELIVLAFVFRNENAERYHDSKPLTLNLEPTNKKAIFKYRATWISAIYFLAYVGTETAISGWIVLFMAIHRHATLYLASFCSSGFWAGQAIGRMVLGTVTDRVGVERATAGYFVCAIVLQVLFVLVRAKAASIAIMSMMGFFMGPLFPSGVVVLARLLPKELHVVAVSFVASIGQVGGAILPFGIGAVVDGLGIGVFQYAIMLFTGISLGLWAVFTQLRPEIEIAVGSGEIEEEDERIN